MEPRSEERSYLLAEGDSQAESAFLQNRWPALELLMAIRVGRKADTQLSCPPHLLLTLSGRGSVASYLVPAIDGQTTAPTHKSKERNRLGGDISPTMLSRLIRHFNRNPPVSCRGQSQIDRPGPRHGIRSPSSSRTGRYWCFQSHIHRAPYQSPLCKALEALRRRPSE